MPPRPLSTAIAISWLAVTPSQFASTACRIIGRLTPTTTCSEYVRKSRIVWVARRTAEQIQHHHHFFMTALVKLFDLVGDQLTKRLGILSRAQPTLSTKSCLPAIISTVSQKASARL